MRATHHLLTHIHTHTFIHHHTQLDVEVLRAESTEHVTITLEASA